MPGEGAVKVEQSTPLAETAEPMDVLTAPPVEPINGEADKEKPKSKKRKKKDTEGAEEEPTETADGAEKKKKKKKKPKVEE